MKRTDLKELKHEVASLFGFSSCTKDAKLALLIIAKAEGYSKREVEYSFCHKFDYNQLICDAVQKFEEDDAFAEKVRELL